MLNDKRPPSSDRAAALLALLRERIVILDGAMGTMIQTYGLDEAGYRGAHFKRWPRDVKGNNDLLNLTQPHVIEAIHRQYLEAGADIIETNTFNSNAISMADYGMESLVPELNLAGAKNARAAADAVMAAQPGRICFVAGAIGPTTKSASIVTRCQQSRRPERDLRPVGGGLLRAGARACWRAARTFCWSKRCSIRSIPRRPCLPSPSCLRMWAVACL